VFQRHPDEALPSSSAKAEEPVFQGVSADNDLSGILDRPVEPGDDVRIRIARCRDQVMTP
jgi:hypothetical protein